MFNTTRRQTLALIGTGALAAAASTIMPRQLRAATKITVLNWQGYGTDEKWAVKAFTDKTGIEVVHDYFSSEPEMLTKLRTNPGAYDVVLINSARTQQAAGEGLITAIDLSAVKNSAGLSPELKGHPNLQLDGKTYGVSWVWGITSLAIVEGAPKPDSYAALGDPSHKGRVALFDDAVTGVAIGALLSGQDMNNPKDLAAVTEKLKGFKDNVKLLWSSEDQWNKSFAAKEFDLSVYWSGAAVRSKRNSKLPVEFVVPKEGGIGWLDSLCVPAGAANAEAGLSFINYMIDPDFYVEWATKVGAPASANAAAMEKLPADDLNRAIHKPEYLKTMTIQSALPDDRRESFNNLWQEVKAFYAA
ncbi:spermidine/putrescine ABC transporter substrate-binding protein [Rhizobium tubonense]|uniref:Spermidine/putrescine ABC transporter substrate-binding protein n=2 Tax=Rhizobium tubonense TaxID=484088 RepID=A0A2W4DC79_9HYPH|nr:extracellular solute-binding protein [Rhizobium tubonense]PZM14514.1 spermidine/putrescine ABC transporter substrate-binding protein [Rhizobium tubonense]